MSNDTEMQPVPGDDGAPSAALIKAVQEGDLKTAMEQFGTTDLAAQTRFLKWQRRDGYTLLHFAVDNKHDQIVSYLLECMERNPLGIDVLNQTCSFKSAPKDYREYTALDIACHRGSSECIKKLIKANPFRSAALETEAEAGVCRSIPLHLAAKSKNPQVLKSFWETFGEQVKVAINWPNRIGMTPLMLCATYGRNADGVELLLQQGADVKATVPTGSPACEGQNVLHFIVTLSREKPQYIDAYRKIFRAIIRHHVGDQDTKTTLLTSQYGDCTFEPRFADQEMNVLQLATSIGAVSFLEEIVKLLPVECLIDNTGEERVCVCTHSVMKHFVQLKHNSHCDMKNAQSPNATNELTLGRKNPCRALALAHVDCTFDEKAQMSRIRPIVELMWTFYKWRLVAFLLAMILHVSHMCYFTHVHAHQSTVESENINSSLSAPPVGIIFWPICLFLVGTKDVLLSSYYLGWRCKNGRGSCMVFWRNNSMWMLWKRSKFWLVNKLNTISTVGFALLTFIWFNNSSDAKLTSLVIVWGWIHTLQYLHFPAKLHVFVVVIQMIFKDVLYIFSIYAFILVGFGWSLNIYNLPGLSSSNTTSSSGAAVYHLLTTTLGDGALFDEVSLNGTLTIRAIFLAYLCLSVIILLNMLIALMNDQYSSVTADREHIWFVETLDCIARLPYFITNKLVSGDFIV